MENIKLTDIEFVKNESIKNISAIKTSGKLLGVYYPKNQSELIYIYNYLKINNIDFVVTGNGTNVLFSDKNTKYLIISLKKMAKNIKKYRDNIIVSSSILIAQAFQYCYKNNLSCFEKLSTIPGTIGGAIKVNAGCFGSNIFDNLISIKILQNGKIKTLTKDKLDGKYRKTNITDLILSAKFHVENKNRCELIKIASHCIFERGEKQPKGASLGCTFKNTNKYSAGYLIEKCGLKGMRHGDAEISRKHGNFIINHGDASFDDVMYLINLIKEKVKQKFEIDLEEEIQIFP